MAPPTPPNFPTIDQCPSGGLAASTIISDLDGSLLRGRNSFPYFALTAFETGGPVRLLLLIVISPLAAFLYHFVSESAGIQVLIFASLAGAKISSIESAAKAVLPKFYMEDLHPETWRVLSASRRRCVVTENPTVMVEPFLKEYLGVDLVLGTELNALRGRATGFVRRPGVLVGEKKAAEVKRLFGDATPPPEIGIGGRPSNFAFMKLCKAAYIVRPGSTNVRTDEAEGEQAQPKPVIFHDGRLVQRPTVLVSLLTLLWLPAGFLLSCVRVAASSLLPIRLAPYYFRLLGIRLSVSGSPPPVSSCKKGSLYISSHRTLLDPFIISVALGRPISTVTYSLSPFSELISPIRTIRLTRNRSDDASAICQLLREDDVVICPEGTTCREPYLLRFSALFAELANEIVPVAAESRTSMFHGTTARGWKWMDPFYFFMNPVPAYHITFLGRLPREMTCAGGKTSFEVANYVQRIIAATLCFQCTDHTRKDKYMALAKNDGTVPKNKTKTRSTIK